MAVKWNSRNALGSITPDAGLTCAATNGDGSRCLTALNQMTRAQILSEIDGIKKKAPADLNREKTRLENIALNSFCQRHSSNVRKANAVSKWQRALATERAALAIKRELQSIGIGDGSDNMPDSADTTGTTIPTGNDSNLESNVSQEIEELHDSLAQVTLEVETLRPQIERFTPELDELRQQLARATPEAEVRGLHEQLERATVETDQLRHNSEEVRLENEDFRLENRRLRRTIEAVRRISTNINAESTVEEGQTEPPSVQSEQTQESDMQVENAESMVEEGQAEPPNV